MFTVFLKFKIWMQRPALLRGSGPCQEFYIQKIWMLKYFFNFSNFRTKIIEKEYLIETKLHSNVIDIMVNMKFLLKPGVI